MTIDRDALRALATKADAERAAWIANGCVTAQAWPAHHAYHNAVHDAAVVLALLDMLDESEKDTQRMDWLYARVDGTGETLLMGGVCSWGISIQRGGQRSKVTMIGEGGDLREAIDDAAEREEAECAPIPEPAHA